MKSTDGVQLRLCELADGASATALVPRVEGQVAAMFVARHVGKHISVGSWLAR